MAEPAPRLSDPVSWLYVMHKSSASLYEAVSSYAANAEGQFAEELQRAVYAVENTGTDIYSALSDTAVRTKNPAFQKFLSEYLTAVKTSGDPAYYLEKKLAELRAEEAAAEEKRASSLAVFAEIFISIFVAGILFAVIVFLILGIMSDGSPLPLAAVVYGMLPLGTAGFLLVLELLYPAPKLPKKQKLPALSLRSAKTEEEMTIREKVEAYDRYFALKSALRNPAAALIKKPHFVFIISAPIAAAAGCILYFTNTLPLRFSLCAAILICFTPYAVFSLLERRARCTAETEFPSVCRIIASAADRGLPLSKCISAAAEENSGVLKKELSAAARDISFGGGVAESLFRFAERLPLPSVKRTVLLTSEAGRFSGDSALPFQMCADDAAHSNSLREGQKSGMQLYILIMYISYFVFIFVQFILSGVFIEAISAAKSSVNTEIFLGILTDAVLIHGVCCGLAAGKLSGAGLSSGILHACILLLTGAAASVAAMLL